MKTRVVDVNGVRLGNDRPLVLVAGPCVLESEALLMTVAERLVELCRRVGLPLILKTSYDKANRTSGKSCRGPGLKAARGMLTRVRTRFRVPLLVDVHTPGEAAEAAGVADILQIPAFLCRQTDLVLAAGRTGRAVNIKKGQFLSPGEVRHIVEKVESTGNRRILLTERGTSFGYHNLVVDMRSLEVMKRTGYPVLLDATHACQEPGAAVNGTGGAREFVPCLARAAAGVGVAGLFMEVHPHPARAKSDAATQWPLSRVEGVLKQVMALDHVVKEEGE